MKRAILNGKKLNRCYLDNSKESTRNFPEHLIQWKRERLAREGRYGSAREIECYRSKSRKASSSCFKPFPM